MLSQASAWFLRESSCPEPQPRASELSWFQRVWDQVLGQRSYIFFCENQQELCVLQLCITESFFINGLCSLCCVLAVIIGISWYIFHRYFYIITLQLIVNFGRFSTKENHFPIFINPPPLHLGALWRSMLASRNATELFRKLKTFSLAVNHAAFDFVKQWLYWCWLRFMNDEVEDHLLSEAHNVALNKRLNKEEKAVWISDILLIRSSNSRLRGCRSHDNDRCWMWDNNAHVAPHSVTFSHVENLSE